jgi:hypothetical protein
VAAAAAATLVLGLLAGCSEPEPFPDDADKAAEFLNDITSDVATNISAQTTGRVIQLQLSVSNNGPQTIFRPTTVVTVTDATFTTVDPTCSPITSSSTTTAKPLLQTPFHACSTILAAAHEQVPRSRSS